MASEKPIETRLVVSITPKMSELLDTLVETGLFGYSAADAARRLIEQGLQDLASLREEEHEP